MSDTPEVGPTDPPVAPSTEPLTRRSLRQSGGARRATAAAAGSTPAPATAATEATPAVAVTGPASERGGIRALLAKHPIAWRASALAVAFLILGTSAVFAGIAVGSGSDAAPLPTESEGPQLRTQPSAQPAAAVIRTCSIAGAAADPNLANFSGVVMNANTGEVLFDRNATAPNSTGSVLKVLTAAAGLSALGPDYRFTTKVVPGSAPGSIVLVGGGDVTLARDGDNVYPEPPSLDDLADQVNAAWDATHDEPITEIIIDATMWDPADNWDDSWLRKEQTDGYQAEVTALMVDGDRDDPYSAVSSRSDDPVDRAADAFADALGVSGDVTFSTGTAASSTVLGQVQSAPLSTLVGYMLSASDNVLAEAMARVVSETTGHGGGSGSLAQAIPAALAKYGVPTEGLAIRDGSGLSGLNGVPPQYVATLMIKIRADENGLGVIHQSLPVAGQSGTLAGRFNGESAAAAGSVFAKTGWLDNEYALAGIINAGEGTPLTFAFYAIRDGVGTDYDAGEAAKAALDFLAYRAWFCGNNTSNN